VSMSLAGLPRTRGGAGGVPINHTLLSDFHRTQGDLLDQLLTDSLTALIEERLLALDEVITDETKVAAMAGRGSMVQKAEARLSGLGGGRTRGGAEAGGRERRGGGGTQVAAVSLVEDKAVRISSERMAELEQEKAERAKQHMEAEAKGAGLDRSVHGRRTCNTSSEVQRNRQPCLRTSVSYVPGLHNQPGHDDRTTCDYCTTYSVCFGSKSYKDPVASDRRVIPSLAKHAADQIAELVRQYLVVGASHRALNRRDPIERVVARVARLHPNHQKGRLHRPLW
jgi:hypothetical protein